MLDIFNDEVAIQYQASNVDDMEAFINEVKNAADGAEIFNAINKLSRVTNALGCGHTLNRCLL